MIRSFVIKKIDLFLNLPSTLNVSSFSPENYGHIGHYGRITALWILCRRLNFDRRVEEIGARGKGTLAGFKGRILWHVPPPPHTLTHNNISTRVRPEEYARCKRHEGTMVVTKIACAEIDNNNVEYKGCRD